MDTVTQIETKEIIVKSEIVAFSTRILSLDLFNSVTLVVSYLDAQGILKDTKIITLEGQDYLDWSNNDEYIINKVAEICGFILKPTPPPTS